MITKQILPCFVHEQVAVSPLPLILIAEDNYGNWLKEQNEFIQNWLISSNFDASKNNFCFLPNKEGRSHGVLVIISNHADMWQLAHLPFSLPEGHYALPNEYLDYWGDLALGWGLGAYQFTAFKKPKRAPASLVMPKVLPETACPISMQSQLQAWYLVRDLINMPTESLGPEELATAAFTIAQYYDAKFEEIVGDDLLEKNYPAIHTVGRASNKQPRLVDLRYGDEAHPKLTLVGKGVCFDSGGLDLKSAQGLALMKKDMGGAAHVLGLASLIMDAKLNVRLRVLIPCVENSISNNAYRPGDVIQTRAGLSVEVGNTDAEGRLILADALAEAASEQPKLIIDFATLTGAARVALGTQIAAMFCNEEKVAHELMAQSIEQAQPMLQLPLFKAYREYIDSDIADISNNSNQPYAGAITAALFLQEFIGDIPWVHFDLMAWNIQAKPGRPKGGEAMCLLAVLAFLQKHFA